MDKMKAVGVIATVLGMGATFVSDLIKEKEREAVIDEKIQKAIAEERRKES